jgi:hypothetical protein
LKIQTDQNLELKKSPDLFWGKKKMLVGFFLLFSIDYVTNLILRIYCFTRNSWRLFFSWFTLLWGILWIELFKAKFILEIT